MDQLRRILVDAWICYDKVAIALADAEIRQLLPFMPPSNGMLREAKVKVMVTPKKKFPPPAEGVMAAAEAAAELFNCDVFDVLSGSHDSITVRRARAIAGLAMSEEFTSSDETVMNSLGVTNTNAKVFLSKMRNAINKRQLKWYKQEHVTYVRSKINEALDEAKNQRLP